MRQFPSKWPTVCSWPDPAPSFPVLRAFSSTERQEKKKLEDQVKSLELHYNHKLEDDAGLGEKESKGEVMHVSVGGS